MKPRARSVYFSKFILNSLSLFRSPNGAAETSSQGVWLRHRRPRAGTAARKCRQWLRPPEGASEEFWAVPTMHGRKRNVHDRGAQ
jgi:hypothetical protein